MNTIEEYVDQIIIEKGFDTEAPEVIAQLKEDIAEHIENRINAMIITSIPEDKLSEFEALLDGDDQEKIQTYIRKEIPDIDEKVAIELAQFKATYLA